MINVNEGIAPLFVEENGGNHFSELRCPVCGQSEGLHQGAVVVRNRSEDQPCNVVRVGRRGKVKKERVDDSRLPGRRDTLDIDFWCECCGKLPCALRIYQHKGTTFLSWVLKISIQLCDIGKQGFGTGGLPPA